VGHVAVLVPAQAQGNTPNGFATATATGAWAWEAPRAGADSGTGGKQEMGGNEAMAARVSTELMSGDYRDVPHS
jgi:hypothetical protein